MANEETTTEAEDSSESASGGNLKKIILLVLVALILIAASIGGTVFFMSGSEAQDNENPEGEAGEEVVQQPAVYVPIKPALLINFMHNGRRRLLEVSVTLMSRDMDVVNGLQANLQLIKHHTNNVISSHAFEELQTDEGKELMRQALLKKLQQVMLEEIQNDGVEQVLFESFVMQ